MRLIVCTLRPEVRMWAGESECLIRLRRRILSVPTRFLVFWPSFSAHLRYLCFLARSLLGQRVHAIDCDLISKERAALLHRHICTSATSGNYAVAVMQRFDASEIQREASRRDHKVFGEAWC
ncbi:MAG: hypothetical protein GY904_21815 [Planctomycetaceae bacterium]|nr:hypothetical protein [Planctomycetaceae bacterium]